MPRFGGDNVATTIEDIQIPGQSQDSPSLDASFILKKLEDDRKAYQDSLTRTHELLIHVLGGTSASLRNDLLSPSSSALRKHNSSFPTAARLTRDHIEQRGTMLGSYGLLGDPRNEEVSSLHADFEFNPEASESEDEDEAFFAQDPLPERSHSEEGLRQHIVKHYWTEARMKILGSLPHTLLHTELPVNLGVDYDRSQFSYQSIYDVLNNGTLSLSNPPPSRFIYPRVRQIWDVISHVNTNQNGSTNAVGRITIVREPSPLLFAALHYTFEEYSDMDEIFALLTANEVNAVPHRPWDRDLRHRKTFLFALNYLTIVGEECQPMAWQSAGEEMGDSETYIPIARCGSVIALSLLGEPSNQIVDRRRASLNHCPPGTVYDPFAPWHVLNITAYPDWTGSVDIHNSKFYVNGTEAFLAILRSEFKDARKRLMKIHETISDLVSTPSDFMFRRAVRDSLFFDDADFSYLRRFSWAIQALSTLNETIHKLRNAYHQTFDDDFWKGKNKILWPSNQSQRHAFWRKRLKGFRRDMESEIRGLEEFNRLNDEKMKEISALRQTLFSGISIVESRKAVMQGQNIKTLTLVTIFFLPLVFVTSVFGMTNMNPNDNFVRFGIVLVVICLPTYVTIGFLDSERGFNIFERFFQHLPRWIIRRLRREETVEMPLNLGKYPCSRFGSWFKSPLTIVNGHLNFRLD